MRHLAGARSSRCRCPSGRRRRSRAAGRRGTGCCRLGEVDVPAVRRSAPCRRTWLRLDELVVAVRGSVRRSGPPADRSGSTRSRRYLLADAVDHEQYGCVGEVPAERLAIPPMTNEDECGGCARGESARRRPPRRDDALDLKTPLITPGSAEAEEQRRRPLGRSGQRADGRAERATPIVPTSRPGRSRPSRTESLGSRSSRRAGRRDPARATISVAVWISGSRALGLASRARPKSDGMVAQDRDRRAARRSATAASGIAQRPRQVVATARSRGGGQAALDPSWVTAVNAAPDPPGRRRRTIRWCAARGVGKLVSPCTIQDVGLDRLTAAAG